MEHYEYSKDYNQIFANESHFGIKQRRTNKPH